MNNKANLSLDDFKKWMESQEADKTSDGGSALIGQEVQPRTNAKKLFPHIELETGEDKKGICKEFCENGGIIKGIEEHNFLIEVASGSFFIDRIYVRRV